MARGKPWTETENKLLIEMAQEGATPEEIIKSQKFPNRTPPAIQMQLSRLGKIVKQKNFTTQQIREAQIVGLDAIVKRYIDAFNKICDMTEYRKEELERFRIIFMAAWKYRDLFREYEKIEEVKARVEKLERLVEQLLSEKKTETPKQAA